MKLIFFIAIGTLVPSVGLGQSRDIFFEMPDIKTPMISHNGVRYDIEAYPGKNNTKEKPNSMVWVTIGDFKFVQFPSTDSFLKIHENTNTIDVNVEILDENEINAIVDAAKREYSLNQISSKNVSLVPIDYIRAFVEYNSKVYEGIPKDTNRHQIIFKFSFKNKNELKNFEQFVRLGCDMTFRYIYGENKKIKMNSLKIKAKTIAKSDTLDRLLGNKDKTYLTRNMLNEISSEIYNSMDIISYNEISEDAFSKVFLEKIIENHIDLNNQNIEISSILENKNNPLYENIIEDISADVLNKEMSKIFEVKNDGEKEYIYVNKEKLNELGDGYSIAGGIGGSAFGFGAEVHASYSKGKHKKDEKKDVNSTLNEMNSHSESDVKWERKGKFLVPKSVKLFLVSKNNFKRDMIFSKIHKISVKNDTSIREVIKHSKDDLTKSEIKKQKLHVENKFNNLMFSNSSIVTTTPNIGKPLCTKSDKGICGIINDHQSKIKSLDKSFIDMNAVIKMINKRLLNVEVLSELNRVQSDINLSNLEKNKIKNIEITIGECIEYKFSRKTKKNYIFDPIYSSVCDKSHPIQLQNYRKGENIFGLVDYGSTSIKCCEILLKSKD